MLIPRLTRRLIVVCALLASVAWIGGGWAWRLSTHRAWITDEQFDRLRVGITVSEAAVILGQPPPGNIGRRPYGSFGWGRIMVDVRLWLDGEDKVRGATYRKATITNYARYLWWRLTGGDPPHNWDERHLAGSVYVPARYQSGR
jgi:hypothetical protein